MIKKQNMDVGCKPGESPSNAQINHFLLKYLFFLYLNYNKLLTITRWDMNSIKNFNFA